MHRMQGGNICGNGVESGGILSRPQRVRMLLHTACKRAAISCAFALLPLLASGQTAGADSANVYFGANVNESNQCTVVVNRDGTLGTSADLKTLSSKLPGGLAGIADIYSGRNYFISAETYQFFTSSPSGGSDDTTFEARFSGQDIVRGRTFAEQPGSQAVRLRGGVSITRVFLHLVATRATGSFPTGAYTGTVVVRCE